MILWRQARRLHKLPEPTRLAQARKSVGYKFVRLKPKRQSVELLAPDMRLDLGGIAKGYAVDEALKVLCRLGIHEALVEGGGDLAVSDPPPGKKGWRVEISPLDVTNAPPKRFALLRQAAISTSGDLYQRLEIDGKRYSHIVDPHTGIGLTDHSLVTIIARDATTADGLSKVVSVLGAARGFPIVHAKHAEARVVRKPADKIEEQETAGFRKHYRNDLAP